MKKEFIVYPKTKIDISNPNVQIIDAPLKVKLKAFVTGYREDHGELPSIERIQSIFQISKQDAEIALTLFGNQ
ncbi:hypothetical protein MKY15_20735 [Sporosarcina sp. FSL K6-1540]|uniref:hypothetical protein n=1 Tax=Sporosarcina sp. FSL K6-1540 TaxID=2921555 RepID=UPI00315AC0E6